MNGQAECPDDEEGGGDAEEGRSRGIDWGRIDEIALGVLGMTPEQLDRMTMPELKAKLKGFKEFHGIKEKEAPMSRGSMEAMMKEFPDGELPRHVRKRIKKGKRAAGLK